MKKDKRSIVSCTKFALSIGKVIVRPPDNALVAATTVANATGGLMSVEAEIAEVVHKRGWFGAIVFDHDPPFVYSIGLMETYQHPELVVFGLETREAEVLLAGIIRQISDGEQFSSASIRTVRVGDTNHRVGIRRVDSTQHPLYLGYAMGYCRHIGRWGELDAMQVFWPDRQGKFPFEAGFAGELSDLQPRLDIPLTQDEIEEFERQFE